MRANEKDCLWSAGRRCVVRQHYIMNSRSTKSSMRSGLKKPAAAARGFVPSLAQRASRVKNHDDRYTISPNNGAASLRGGEEISLAGSGNAVVTFIMRHTGSFTSPATESCVIGSSLRSSQFILEDKHCELHSSLRRPSKSGMNDLTRGFFSFG